MDTKDEVAFSHEYISEFFDGIPYEHHYDLNRKYDIHKNNAVIVYGSEKYNPEFIRYIEEYNVLGYNYIIIHLSDESYKHDISYYKIAKKVFRTYYNIEYTEKYNVETIPLGYKSGIVRYNKDEIKYLFNFIGQMKTNRYDMLDVFKKTSYNYFVHLTNQWNDPNSINGKEYYNVLSDSLFTLCPMGWINMDSFRICEALEMGSIPIVLRDVSKYDYYKNVFGEHPFIIGDTWEEVYDRIENMCETDYIQYRENVLYWYKGFKYDLKKNILKNFISF